MRRVIAVYASIEWLADMNTKLRDATVQDVFKFNPKHAHLYGLMFDLMYNSYTCFLVHNEFPEVPEGDCLMRYSIKEARERFPYLFVDTNPILYRRFRL